MQMVTNGNVPEVHLLGLGWHHVSFLSVVLGTVEQEHRNATWQELAGELGDLLDAGTENHIKGSLSSNEAEETKPQQDHL